MQNVQHTGTMPQQEADAQQERIKQIMADTGLPFGPAVDKYIEEKQQNWGIVQGVLQDATPRSFVHR